MIIEWGDKLIEIGLSVGMAVTAYFLKQIDSRISDLEDSNTLLELEKLRGQLIQSESNAKDRYVDKVEYLSAMSRLHDKMDEIIKLLMQKD